MLAASILLSAQALTGPLSVEASAGERLWGEAWETAERLCPKEVRAFEAQHPIYGSGMLGYFEKGWSEFDLATHNLLLSDEESGAFRHAVAFVVVANAQAGSLVNYIAYLREKTLPDGMTAETLKARSEAGLALAECLQPPEGMTDVMQGSLLTAKIARQLDDVLEMLACKDWFAASRRMLAVDPAIAGTESFTAEYQLAMGTVGNTCGKGILQ